MPRYDCTLWTLLKNSELTSSNEIALSERLQILTVMLEVVIHIQAKGYCHLDIKPSNVLVKLNEKGNWNHQDIVLTDFGLCLRKWDMSKLTSCSGTPGFASLEQFLGGPTMRSDNYSLGKTAILILFKWQLGWNLLAQPLTPSQFQGHLLKNTLVAKIISNLLHVSSFNNMSNIIINNKLI